MLYLVAVSESAHTRHDAEDIVVGCVDADLSGLGALYSGVGKNELESSVIDAAHVAAARRLVFFWAKSKGVYLDTGIGCACVVLEWLYKVEVGTFALRESVLSVKLELSGDDRVFTPAVHVKSGFGEDECSGIAGSSVAAFETTNSFE